MLTEAQANRVWQKMYAAEVRSLYFGDLAGRYTRQKQVITGLAFFLSSGAAATVAAKLPPWVPLTSASLSAAITAYSIAVGLDRKAASMSKLQYSWSAIASGFERLRNHWYEEDAENLFEELLKQSRDASQAGTTDGPYDEALLAKWQERVNCQYGIAHPA